MTTDGGDGLRGSPGRRQRGGFTGVQLPIQEKVMNTCPACKHGRSRKYATKPGDDGRMEYHRCRRCGERFRVWDSDWRPLEAEE